MSNPNKPLSKVSGAGEISAFLNKAKALAPQQQGGNGRLLFALDATASREPVWDRATQIQSQMFLEAAKIGSLNIKLAFYRGFMDCQGLPWTADTAAMLKQMGRIRCEAGTTQIARLLKLAINEHKAARLNAMVFVGDCMEEDPDQLTRLAGQLGINGVPVFVFQDGHDPIAEKTFREIARLTRGVWCRFDASSPDQLRDLLCGVAVYAAGGQKALKAFSNNKAGLLKQLTNQLGK